MTSVILFCIPWAVTSVVNAHAVCCDNVVISDRNFEQLYDDIVDDFVFESASDVKQLNDTKVSIPLTENKLFNYKSEEFRGRYAIGISDHAKKLILPFLMGITLKVMTFIPLHVAAFFIMGSVALFASKSALLMALLAAYLSYLTKKHKKLVSPLDELMHYRPLDDWYKLKFMNHPMSHFHSYYRPYTANWYMTALTGRKVLLRKTMTDEDSTHSS